MAIKGSLREASLAEVCQLLALGMKTGCLSVADRSRFGQIFFDRGRITFARIVNRRDRLGDLLVAENRVEQAQIDATLEQQAREPEKRLGELLVERGLINASELSRYIRIQIEEAIYHLFTWSRGQFYFEPGQRPQRGETLISINPESLLLEAARRVDEWSLIEKKIPSLDLVFELEHARIDASDAEISDEQKELLPLLDGKRSVLDIVDETGRGEFDVGKALFGLIQAGFARRVGRRAEDPGRASEAELAERNNLGIAFYRTGMLEDAVREFRRALEVGPSDIIARFHLALVSIRMARYGEAVRELEQLARETGMSFPFASNLAVALRRMDRTEDALRMLDEADRLRPGVPATALARAITLAEAHRLAEATVQFDEYRSRIGESERPAAVFFYHAALAAALAGDVRRAQALVWEGLEYHGDSPALLLLAGLTAEKQEDRQGAEMFYRRALEAEPGLAQAHKNLGDIAYARGAAEEALRLYQRAVELDSELGEDVHARLGLLHYQTRNREAAIRAWTRALELNPANEAVRNRLEVLLHART